ncbi:MAG: SPFH domain-containing protein [Bacillota bacterium]|nr:SPFH domain-containing protein [Bacillota bacterium]
MSISVIIAIVVALVILCCIFMCFTSVSQGTVVIITLFGKYRRTLQAGLNFKFPWEKKYRVVSLQNISQNLQLTATTSNQALVKFDTTILYHALDSSEDTVKNIAFKFISNQDFLRQLQAIVENEVRTLIAKHTQQEILGIKEELQIEVLEKANESLKDWGWKLSSLQISVPRFGEEVERSMESVVASINERTAAENRGEALKIQATKEAEAKGRALEIEAEAEKNASKLRGEGMAEFRKAMFQGIAESATAIEQKGISADVLPMLMYMDTLKDIAKDGQGKIIFIDNGINAPERFMEQITSLNQSIQTTDK